MCRVVAMVWRYACLGRSQVGVKRWSIRWLRYSEEDWKEREGGTAAKKRTSFKTSQTFPKKKKKRKNSSNWKSVARVVTKLLVMLPSNFNPREILNFFLLRTRNYSFVSSPLRWSSSTLESIYRYFSETRFPNAMLSSFSQAIYQTT